MFRYYKLAKVCYVYLQDVSKEEHGKHGYQECEKNEEGVIVKPRVGSIEHSDWFTRGWTLQELLAPTSIYFFDRYWRLLGTKETLSAQIQAATEIKAQYLTGDLSEACIATKMNWLAKRQTARIEDMAYCMFGLFGITTFIRYGEGEGAFLRLEQELIRQKPLDESLFAWRRLGITSCGLLAPWPTCYLDSGNLVVDSLRYARRNGLTVVAGGIHFEAPNKLPENGNAREWMALRARFRRSYKLKLNCWEPRPGRFKGLFKDTITIRLEKDRQGNWRRVHCNEWSTSFSPRHSHSIFGAKTRPIQIPHTVGGEQDWGLVLAEEWTASLKQRLIKSMHTQ